MNTCAYLLTPLNLALLRNKEFYHSKLKLLTNIEKDYEIEEYFPLNM